jgi:hypothetical protein
MRAGGADGFSRIRAFMGAEITEDDHVAARERGNPSSGEGDARLPALPRLRAELKRPRPVVPAALEIDSSISRDFGASRDIG